MQRLDRRGFLSRGAALLALPGAITAAACREAQDVDRPLAPIAANWVLALHPAIDRVSAGVALPSRASGDPVDDFVREARSGMSTWDTYIGMTPWVEMARLVEESVIEPWDEFIPERVRRNILPKIRAEATLNGHLWSWPFLVDVIVQGSNGELVERAGLDPTRAPASWDDYIGNARKVVEAGVAPYGCTFDPSGWRSLVPIAHSLGTDLYTDDGLFHFTHPATVEALEVMRRMVELSHPDVLDSDAVLLLDEAAFAAQTVAYSIKYQNAQVQLASGWTDPTRLQLAGLPANGGRGGTVFWTVGLALLRYGRHKHASAEYAAKLTHDERVWRSSLGTGFDTAGQLPAFKSLPPWSSSPPTWKIAPWVPAVADALSTASAIRPHPLGAQQFAAARPYWEDYLRGSERSPRRALARAMRAARDRVAAFL